MRGRRSGETVLFLHWFCLYGWQDNNTNLHEILTDIAAKRKPRRGVAALLGSKKHFKGEGGCCGGGGDVKIKPKHLDTIVATKKLHIEGMSCVNCQNRIENALNGMAQVNAKASFKKGEAIVKLGADVPEEELCEAVEKLGYKVTSIELM